MDKSSSKVKIKWTRTRLKLEALPPSHIQSFATKCL